ncbi:hypothetical protein QQG09_07305 [Melissococcus plutonius]|uniref:Uncharacterized protein n=2 Tax=Melissococcus plutonius TaxID=33970 RepID=F3YA38_MELPT|nr:hypothetical protein [Melissococcus plutonius]BAL62262.1 hypothetical protein MPD5_1035 [Melissococcus plutonius DAT561]KMT32178.1 hypothetical protein MEPL6_3c01690 [Melissococcus plutonius]KMT34749.1 hypothetical protein MEPL8_3c03150 [Melissococcus plutonius]KMT40680.1 hypothetical protein MEPL12_2c03140 [Melissococcus plutonius]MBB5176869.1 hypothetical protein [Melissococcus plutonius]
MSLKEKITDTTERLYDLANNGRYHVEVNMFPRKKDTNKKIGIHAVSTRNTSHNKKWRAKN